MHIALTLTSIHDRYSASTPCWKPTVKEIYHWSQGAALLNKKLSTTWPQEDRDSLWTAAALLGAVAFSSVEASMPEEAWPIKESDPGDLAWLRMSDGKKVIWDIADPLRPESAFYNLALELVTENMFAKNVPFVMEDLPRDMICLLELDETSTEENNPYYSSARTLAPLLDMECNHSTIARFLALLNNMGTEFKKLMIQKDPRALLVLAYWYSKASHGTWWVAQRSLVEGQAICLYLERCHPHETLIQGLLDFPRMELGML